LSVHKYSKQSQLKRSPGSGKETVNKKKFLLRSVPVYIFLLMIIIPVGSMAFYVHHLFQADNVSASAFDAEQHDPKVEVVRENDLSLIQPLLFVEIESKNALNPLKRKISDFLEQKSREGVFTSASVYLKELSTGFYLNINPDSLYDPASLMKVPLLLIYLKQAETNPELLKRTYLFTQDPKNKTVGMIKDKSLVNGNRYTVEELLYYMIVYSDNESFWILSDNVDAGKFEELDAALNIPGNYDIIHYPKSDKHFIAGVNSMAHYFNVLYNATYLNKAMSAYALNLLTKSTYRDGIVKDIGSNVLVAHKFGERTISYMADGRLENLQSEFHEFGIVYLKDRPYILGVMTRGKRSDQLPAIVSGISKIAYDEFNAKQ
jgi:beta-lactamase class A